MNKFFVPDGSRYISNLIAEAVANGSRRAVVRGNYLIGEEIRIPSDFTLILDSCHLKMETGCYSIMFVNEHHNTPEGKTLEGTDRNITILGQGEVILDGGEYNGLSETTASKNGLPPIWKNNTIFFANVDGFRIQNLTFHNNRWWAVNMIFCRNGYVSDLTIQSNDTAIDETGKEYHKLTRQKKHEVLVKNADGVDIRKGCYNITVENIFGFIEDDTVAITGLNGRMEALFGVEGMDIDIRNIQVRNVQSSSFCSNVRILNQASRTTGEVVKIYNIVLDGIYDTSENSPHMERGGYGVRIGDQNDVWGSRPATMDETYNITVRNVRSRAFCALHLAGGMKNVQIENVVPFDGAAYLEDFHTGENVTII